MTIHNAAVKEKAFQQVSLPRAFVQDLTVAALAADRSPAKQLEHYARLAQAIELVLPSNAVQELKAGSYPASELLIGLAQVLANTDQSSVFQRIRASDKPRLSQDPMHPERATLTYQDGRTVHGSLDATGEFVPGPNPSITNKGATKHGEISPTTGPKGLEPARKEAPRRVAAHAAHA